MICIYFPLFLMKTSCLEKSSGIQFLPHLPPLNSFWWKRQKNPHVTKLNVKKLIKK